MKIIINGEVVEIPGGSPTAPSNAALPIGAIIMWAGTVETIPEGWHICDGTEGTIDLRNRFALGAGDKYTPGATGGAEEVTLTVDQMPSHTHDVPNIPFAGSTMQYSNGTPTTPRYSTTDKKTSTSSGGSKPHTNMPPYYALYFIQKIA